MHHCGLTHTHVTGAAPGRGRAMVSVIKMHITMFLCSNVLHACAAKAEVYLGHADGSMVN